MSYGQEEKDESVQALMDVNGLRYMMTPGVSCSTTRILREWDAQRPSYNPGDIMQFIVGSGAAFVDPKNSYIKFTLRITTLRAKAASYRFFWGMDTKGRQNALQLFEDMRLTHSSGYEIDRMQAHFGAWTYYRDSFTKSKEWYDTVGAMMRGYQTNLGHAPDAGGHDGSGGALVYSFPQETAIGYNDQANLWGLAAPAVLNNQFLPRRPFFPEDDGAQGILEVQVVLPLSCISGIWDNDQLSPPYLMAGLNLQMTVAQKYRAFMMRTTADPINIADDWNLEIIAPKLCLETITFTDAVLRALSMTSVTSGLEMPFTAVHYLANNAQNSNNTIQINRGLSRANAVFIRNYLSNVYANNAAAMILDSQAADFVETGPNNGFQVKLGSEFMPTRPLDTLMTLYQACQVAFGNMRADIQNTVTPQDYGGHRATHVFAVLGLFGGTLEKSSTLAQSGSPISASRDLQVNWGSNAPAGNRLVDAFVPYVVLATFFADSVLIRT